MSSVFIWSVCQAVVVELRAARTKSNSVMPNTNSVVVNNVSGVEVGTVLSTVLDKTKMLVLDVYDY